MRIELRELRATHGSRAVVDGVTLSIAEGELLALLGPSGSGKTTLLLALAGLHPAQGEIVIDGRPANGLAPRRRGFGMVFQGLALWPHLSVEGHLRFVLDGAELARGERTARIAETLEELELTALAARLPSQLSGGEAQRLALARALVTRPRALLLDEPFGSLDARLRERMLALVAALHGRYRTTTLLVTHDYEEAFALAERVAVIHAGRVLQTGPPEEVQRRPLCARIAATTGTVSIVPGRRDGGEVLLPWGRARAEFADGARAEVVALLRPEELRVLPGSGATVRRCSFRAGGWRAEVEIAGQVVCGLARERLAEGAPASLEVVEPVWCTRD